MKWIVYTAVLVNQVTREATRQIRRAPIMMGDDPTMAADRLGGTLLAVQPDIRRAEGLRRLTEMQGFLAGHNIVEWTPPAEWCRETPLAFATPCPALTRHPRRGYQFNPGAMSDDRHSRGI
jgi:hypothetical protein